MKINFFDTLTKDLLKEWKTLWERSEYANLTNSPEWFLAADETYQYAKKKIVAMYADSGKLLGICGLVEERIAGVTVWTCAAREFADKQPLLLDFSKKKEVQQFVNALEVVGLTYIINVNEKYVDMFSQTQRASVLSLDVNSYIDFSAGPYGNFKQSKASHLHKKLLRDGHTMKADAKITDKMTAMKTIFAIEEHSSKKQNGKAVFDQELPKKFYFSLLTHAQQYINIALVWIDEKPVAYSIDFVNKNSTQGSQKAHLPEYNRYSPGRFLIMSLCDRARENGEEYFDFGRGIDDFKKSFVTRIEKTYGVFIGSNNLLREYLKQVYFLRNHSYGLLVKSKNVYRLYRWILKGVRRDG